MWGMKPPVLKGEEFAGSRVHGFTNSRVENSLKLVGDKYGTDREYDRIY
jgi:hypothetical protein